MPGAIATGTAAMSISTSIAIPISIATSIAIRPNNNCSNVGKVARAGGSTTRSIEKAFRIGIREPPRSLTGQAPMMRSNRANSFVAERTREGRTSRVMGSVTAVESAIVVLWETEAVSVIEAE